MQAKIETNFERYDRLRQARKDVADCIADELMHSLEVNADTVRTALGSFGMKKLEEYRSLREQDDAAFTEWFHEMMNGPLPFG